ncbi:run domain Beclin-1 interacting and cysteine-rich containing protein-like isoform X1, partial [Leptotrombidium deliense]
SRKSNDFRKTETCSEVNDNLEATSLNKSLNNLFACLRETKSESLATLEQENAHFLISDTIISTLENIKSNCFSNNAFQESRPKRRSFENGNKTPEIDAKCRKSAQDNGSLVTPSTSSSSSFLNELSLCSDFEHWRLTHDVLDYNGSPFSETWMSMSTSCMKSLHNYLLNESMRQNGNLNSISPMDLSLTSTVTSCDSLANSAENIAVNLLRKFSETHSIPQNADEMQWIVSEGEVPQRLLPLPPIVNENDGVCENVRLRGNFDWAPLRPQLILNIQPVVKRRIQIARQNFRCAGCGLHIEREYIPRMLHCMYTGKYFCQHGCHSGKKSIIPAYVIHKWDFGLYPVSTYAKNFIDKIITDPLFNLYDLNRNLYKKVKLLNRITELRVQLICLKDYIYTCKKRDTILLKYIAFEAKHFLKSDIHVYSLRDLIDIKMKLSLVDKCNNLVTESVKHISKCSHCQAKGFICEICSANTDKWELLFPFEVGRVKQCNVCSACYHIKCFHNFAKCLKCERIKRRKSLLS